MKDIEYTIPRSQLFFNNYLPGALMEHRDGMYGYVVGTNSRQEHVEKINRELLKEVINEQLELWRTMGGEVDGNLEDAIENNTLVIRSPDEISIRPTPLTLECCRCHLIQLNRGNDRDVIKRLSHMARGDAPTLYCPECKGKMKQIRFVYIHRCGAVNPVNPPFSAMGRRVKIQDGGTFYTTYWIDYDTNNNYGNLFAPRCDVCASTNLNGNNTRGAIIRNGRSETFYPRLTQYISLTPDTTELLESALTQEDGANELGRAIVCGMLGLQDQQTLRKNLKTLTQGNTDTIDLNSLRRKRDNLIIQRDQLETMGMDDMIEAANEKIANLDAKIKQASGLFAEANDYLTDHDILRRLFTSRRSREAAVLPGEFKSVTLQDILREEQDPRQRAVIEENIGVLHRQRAVRELRYIENTSVVLASVGYSRELDNPSTGPHEVPVRLNGYIDEVSDDLSGRTPVYVLPANTEALHIRLDPCSILRWAVDSLGWVIDDITIMDDPAMAHIYILQSAPTLAMEHSIAYNEAKLNHDTNSLNILDLVHTIAHLLMQSAKQGSGYDENSLMEYIFPADLSFLIYVPSTTDYTAGGLLSLFRHNLPEWFDIANVDSLNCLYDPICSQTGGSCHGCTQKSIGCETFNHGLSRAYLHGGTVQYPNGQTENLTSGLWDE